MKFNKSSQLLLASAASLLAASLVTACGTLTTDFVFVTSSSAAGPNAYGQIDVFEINKESGFMRQIPTSPFPSGGRNPVAEAVSSDQSNLYVVNQDDNTIVQFVIGNDGKVYPQNTTNTPGIFPMAVAVNGTNLFVVDTYQPLPICSTAAPCSGSIAVFPITVGTGANPSDPLGAPVANGNLNYWPLTLPSNPTHIIVPTGVNVLASGADVYVTAYDASVAPIRGYVFGFAVGSGGALAPLNGGVPHDMGVGSEGHGIRPSAIASDPTSTYVYVTDSTNGIVVSYSVASGVLTRIDDTPAGDQPSAIVTDPVYPYLYVANALDSTVTAYSISSGALTSLGTYATGLRPVAIGIDPSTNHFLFTVNFLGDGTNGTVSGFELSPSAGTLLNSEDSPFLANSLPTAVAAIPHNTPKTGSSH
ncbi:MAG: beta-propeller fold lactonase family protein [Terracidiphilus sp.]|nr:beta-propeller fold lactonase family protein [Terracidiphilus sp.]